MKIQRSILFPPNRTHTTQHNHMYFDYSEERSNFLNIPFSLCLENQNGTIEWNQITWFIFLLYLVFDLQSNHYSLFLRSDSLSHFVNIDGGWRPKLHCRWCSSGFGFWEFPDSRAWLCWHWLDFRSNGNDAAIFCGPCSANSMGSFCSWRELHNQCGFWWHVDWGILLGHCFW